MEGLDAMGFQNATPVQSQAIPAIMEGRDILACAQTGTGKTAAFLLPILHRITVDPPGGIDTIIVEPTRELAVQVDQQLEGFSYFTPVSSVAIYGGRDGHSMEMEKRALKKGAPIIVATPGRLIAHLDLGYVDLSKVRHLVLDEADRMLDMGFIHDIMKIVNMLPMKRQTLFFSATMPPKIRKLSQEILTKPFEVNIAVSKPAEKIMQAAYDVEDEGKIALTESLLTGKKRLQRVLIFAGTKKAVRDLAVSLQRRGLNVAAIHSDLEQKEREDRLSDFRNGTLPIVVATDVLARGIDINGIDVVINFDVPHDAEDYVHRIGRTARAEASGVALTYINRKDRRRFQRIEEFLTVPVRRLPLPEGLDKFTPTAGGGNGHSRSGGRSGGGGGGDRNRNKRRSRGGRSKRPGQSSSGA